MAEEDDDREPDAERDDEGTEDERVEGRADYDDADEDHAGDGRSHRRANHRLTGRQAVREARQQLFELIGRPVEQVLAMERDDDGEWQVLVQVLELERIPNSTDVLGAYRVTLDDDGEVVGYRRVRRYVRSQADED